MIRSVALLTVIALFGLFISLSFTRPGSKTNAVNGSFKDPASNYKEYCSGCHGEEMNAFVDRKWKHGSTDEDLLKQLR
jgi:hypothetical protein